MSSPADYYDRKAAEAAKIRSEYREAKRLADSCESCGGTGVIRRRDPIGERALDWCDDCTEARGLVDLLKQRLEVARYVGD